MELPEQVTILCTCTSKHTCTIKNHTVTSYYTCVYIIWYAANLIIKYPVENSKSHSDKTPGVTILQRLHSFINHNCLVSDAFTSRYNIHPISSRVHST